MPAEITFAIVALNEEKRIKNAIESCLGRGTCVLYDGGSSDNTVNIAKKHKIQIKSHPNTSIEHRRRQAALDCTTEFICFVDADQVIPDGVSFADIVSLMEKNQLIAGVQLCLKALTLEKNYFSLGFAFRHNLVTGVIGERKVIGTPCLFRTKILSDFGYTTGVSGPCDDTAMCMQIRKAGYKVHGVEEEALEYVRSDFSSTIRKAFWYGMGDAELIIKTKDIKNRLSHLFHVAIREPIVRPVIAAMQKPIYLPFMLVFGVCRLTGFLHGILKRPDLTTSTS